VRTTALDEALADATGTGGLISVRALRNSGVSEAATRRAVKAGRLVRITRGVYARERVPRLPLWLVTEDGLAPAYALHLRAWLMSWGRCAARRRSAALLRGWGVLVEPRKIEIAVPRGLSRKRGRGVLVRQMRDLPMEQIVPITGGAPVPMVPAWHAVIDGLLSLPPLEAVVLADSALRAGDVDLDELHERAASLRGTRQARHARRLLAWCDPESGSVLESVLRYRLLEAGVEGFTTQVPVQHRGEHVLRADFCFAAAGLVVESDGARWHTDKKKDRLTDNALAVAGFRVLRFTWDEVVHGHVEVLRQIREALGTRTAVQRLAA
jgi:very-short-patch-repair endonuclease